MPKKIINNLENFAQTFVDCIANASFNVPSGGLPSDLPETSQQPVLVETVAVSEESTKQEGKEGSQEAVEADKSSVSASSESYSYVWSWLSSLTGYAASPQSSPNNSLERHGSKASDKHEEEAAKQKLGHNQSLIKIFEIASGKYSNKDSYWGWISMFFRHRSFEKTIDDLKSFPDPILRLQAFQLFISEGTWHIGSANTTLIITAIRSIDGYENDEKSVPDSFIHETIIPHLKPLILEEISKRIEARTEFLKKQEEERRRLEAMCLEQIKPAADVEIFDDGQKAKQFAIENPTRLSFCISARKPTEREISARKLTDAKSDGNELVWQLTWYDASGNPHSLKFQSDAEEPLAAIRPAELNVQGTANTVQLDFEQKTEELLKEHQAREKVLFEPTPQELENLKSAYAVTVKDKQLQIFWYDSQSRSQQINLENHTLLVKWFKIKLEKNEEVTKEDLPLLKVYLHPQYTNPVVKLKLSCRALQEERVESLKRDEEERKRLEPECLAQIKPAAEVELFDDARMAKQFAIENPTKLSFHISARKLTEKEFKLRREKDPKTDENALVWQLTWYDVTGNANLLQFKSDVEESLVHFRPAELQFQSTNTVQLHLEQKTEQLLKEYQARENVLFEPTPLELDDLKSAYVVTVKDKQLQLFWYDSQGLSQQVNLVHYSLLVEWLKKKLEKNELITKEDLPILKVYLLPQYSNPVVNLKLRCRTVQEEHLEKTKLLVDPTEKELQSLTLAFTLTKKDGHYHLAWYDSLNKCHPVILENYPKLAKWLNSKKEVSKEDLPYLKTFLQHVKILRKIDHSQRTFQSSMRVPFVAINHFSPENTKQVKSSTFVLTKTDLNWQLFYIDAFQKVKPVELDAVPGLAGLLKKYEEESESEVQPETLEPVQLKEISQLLEPLKRPGSRIQITNFSNIQKLYASRPKFKPEHLVVSKQQIDDSASESEKMAPKLHVSIAHSTENSTLPAQSACMEEEKDMVKTEKPAETPSATGRLKLSQYDNLSLLYKNRPKFKEEENTGISQAKVVEEGTLGTQTTTFI